MTTAAIIPAAGRGVRLGGHTPKALVEVHGLPLVAWAAMRLAESGVIDHIIAVAPAGLEETVKSAITPASVVGTVPVAVVTGGASRQASVGAGLAALDPSATYVLVHDAARALTPPDLVRRVAEALRGDVDAVVAALPVTDTIKRVVPDTYDVAQTVDRRGLWAVQTPQGFRRSVLQEAHRRFAANAAQEDVAATDDAGMVEAMGGRCRVVPGDDLAFKITTWLDLWVATQILGQ